MMVYIFEHASFETPGLILKWVKERGFELNRVLLWDNMIIPDINRADFLIVMGGPMNIYEETLYPWLTEEKMAIKKAIDAGKPVLGICLGAQLISAVLGGKVLKNIHKEIGWFQISKIKNNYLTKYLPDNFDTFHWHGETFTIPDGGDKIFESIGCDNQGFIYRNKVVGFQFHLEMDLCGIKKLISNCKDDMGTGEFVMNEDEILSHSCNIEKCKDYLFLILDKIIGYADHAKSQ